MIYKIPGTDRNISLNKLVCIQDLHQSSGDPFRWWWEFDVELYGGVKLRGKFTPNKDEAIIGDYAGPKQTRQMSYKMIDGSEFKWSADNLGTAPAPSEFDIKQTVFYWRMMREYSALFDAWRDAIGKELYDLHQLIAKILGR